MSALEWGWIAEMVVQLAATLVFFERTSRESS